jgi:hypothetical protein
VACPSHQAGRRQVGRGFKEFEFFFLGVLGRRQGAGFLARQSKQPRKQARLCHVRHIKTMREGSGARDLVFSPPLWAAHRLRG